MFEHVVPVRRAARLRSVVSASLLSGAALSSVLWFTPASAAPLTVTASGVSAQPAPISASATFSINILNQLVIELKNTSTSNLGYHVPDILAGLFFDISGNPVLSPVSAAITIGSVLVNGVIPAGQTIGDQWQYSRSTAGFTNGAFTTADVFGIGAAGFSGIFGHGNFGSNSQNVGGLDYGLVGTDYVSANAHGQAQTARLVENSITFTLSFNGGLPAGFNPSTMISDVTFAYGTAPDSTLTGPPPPPPFRVPEPGSLTIIGLGLIGLGFLRRRRAA